MIQELNELIRERDEGQCDNFDSKIITILENIEGRLEKIEESKNYDTVIDDLSDTVDTLKVSVESVESDVSDIETNLKNVDDRLDDLEGDEK